jgi:hypothetical protein
MVGIIYIVSIILIKLSFVVIHQKKGRIIHPYIHGIVVSSILGIICLFIVRNEFPGIHGPAPMSLSIFVLMCFQLSGLVLAFLYNRKEDDKISEKRYNEHASKAKDVSNSEKNKQNNKD